MCFPVPVQYMYTYPWVVAHKGIFALYQDQLDDRTHGSNGYVKRRCWLRVDLNICIKANWLLFLSSGEPQIPVQAW